MEGGVSKASLNIILRCGVIREGDIRPLLPLKPPPIRGAVVVVVVEEVVAVDFMNKLSLVVEYGCRFSSDAGERGLGAGKKTKKEGRFERRKRQREGMTMGMRMRKFEEREWKKRKNLCQRKALEGEDPQETP